MKFMCDVAKTYVCGLGVGMLLASSGLVQAMQPKGAKISAQTLVAIKKAVAIVQQGNFSAEEKQLLGFVSGLCAGVSELNAVAYVVTGKGFDYTSTYEALAYLAKKVTALQETAPQTVKESYGTVAAALDTLQAEFMMATNGCAPDDARSVTIDLSSVLEKLNEIQAMLSDILALIEAQSDESCCEHLTSLLEVVIANEEAIIADVAAVQTTVDTINGKTTAISATVNTINGTVNTINTTTTATNGTVNTINGTTAATQTTVNTINTTTTATNGTVNTINGTTAATQTTVNTINTTTTATNGTVNTISSTVNSIQATVNEIADGDCIAVYNNGGNTVVISSSGTYCLAESITKDGVLSGPAISITASSVVLNLNGFEVVSTASSHNGIEISTTLSSVVIKNGTIRTTGSANGSNGIFANNVSDISIHDVVTRNWQSAGIVLFQATNVAIDNLTSHDNGTQGILVTSSSKNIVISNSVFENNGSFGVEIYGTTGITVRNVLAQGNGTSTGDGIAIESSSDFSLENCMACENLTGAGFSLNTVTNGTIVGCSAFHNGNSIDRGGFRIIGGSDLTTYSSNVEFTSCVATQNTYSGFYIVGGNSKIVMQKCMASNNNLNGFDLGSVTPGNNNILLDGCLSLKNNSTGFAVGLGTTVSLIQSCRALGNLAYGFNDGGGTNNRYYANVASNSTTANYNGVTNAAVVAAASATYWPANVDASL